MGDTPVVRVTNFVKHYRKHSAVSGVSLEVKPREIYGLIGPDGAGKSTLMKAIAGVLSFKNGEIEVFGVRIDSERAADRIKHRLGFMPQGLGLNLYPELSVEENIDFFARLRLVPKRDLSERKTHLLRITRLERFRDRPMKNLSGGMKQKLGLICTLIHEPDLVILDEPTTGVDPVSRQDFWAILAGLLRERGVTAIVSTAYLDEAARFHRASLLFGGRVLAKGEPRELLSFAPGSLVALQAEPQVQALSRLESKFSQVQALGPWIRIFVEKADPNEATRRVRCALEDVQVRELQVSEPELEDVFIALLPQRQASRKDTRLLSPLVSSGSSQSSNDAAIEAVELVRDFNGFRAVDRVSFQIQRGEIFGLLGANGAGKTTVIKMLVGILPPTAGGGRVAGVNMHGMGRAIRERVGYMSQVFSLYQDLTVVENIRLYSAIYGLNRSETRDRIDWIVDMAGLTGHETDQAGRLPVGLRQRLALGCALVHRPQILFLDEPTSGVDPIGRRQLWKILFQLSRSDGVTILVTTHYMSEVEHCDHVGLMHAGRLVANASPEEMKHQIETEVGRVLEVSVDQPLEALGLLEKAGFNSVSLFGKCVHVLAKDPQLAGKQVRAAMNTTGIALHSIAERPLTMEDVFVYRVLAMENKERVS